MNFALVVGFSVISLFSAAFIVRCYKAQRPPILVAAGGAVAVATLVGLMIGWR
jgi:Na+/citrate or Na+/malate symporter